MKTTIWLKQQPKKKIEYPDCYPQINMMLKDEILFIKQNKDWATEAEMFLNTVARMEFRP